MKDEKIFTLWDEFKAAKIYKKIYFIIMSPILMILSILPKLGS